MYIRRVRTQAIVALAAACWASAVSAQGLGRVEIHTIPSVTVSNVQFLIGDRYGKPVILGGELRLPRGAGEKFSTVILIHGSGGISAATDRWAQEINSIGIAAFILDSFTGRGIINTNSDQSQLDSIAMMHMMHSLLWTSWQRAPFENPITAIRIGSMRITKPHIKRPWRR
jgi:hypothetical protein